MIGGRLKGNTLAVRICCAAPNTRPITACTLSVTAARSAKGFNFTTMKAAFDWLPPSNSEKPTIDSTPWTCGIGCTMPSTFSTSARVRATEAPSGSCTAMKNTPWSSSGRNPVGVRSDRP